MTMLLQPVTLQPVTTTSLTKQTLTAPTLPPFASVFPQTYEQHGSQASHIQPVSTQRNEGSSQLGSNVGLPSLPVLQPKIDPSAGLQIHDQQQQQQEHLRRLEYAGLSAMMPTGPASQVRRMPAGPNRTSTRQYPPGVKQLSLRVEPTDCFLLFQQCATCEKIRCNELCVGHKNYGTVPTVSQVTKQRSMLNESLGMTDGQEQKPDCESACVYYMIGTKLTFTCSDYASNAGSKELEINLDVHTCANLAELPREF